MPAPQRQLGPVRYFAFGKYLRMRSSIMFASRGTLPWAIIIGPVASVICLRA